MTTALVPIDHARLSASGAHRWMHCAGSIAAEAPFPDRSSKYADEGTAAHALAAFCLQTGRDAASLVGVDRAMLPVLPPLHDGSIAGTLIQDPLYPVTPKMAGHIQTYLDFVRSLWVFCDERWIERTEMLADDLGMPDDIGGTSDAGGIDYGAETLHVTDLKFGRGVLVEVDGNEQFRIYALAAYGALTHANKMRLRHVALHVIQPRAEHANGPIRTETITVVELLNWARHVLLPAAHEALARGAPRTAGDWCTFCKAKGDCATFRDSAFKQLSFVFEDVGPTLAPADNAALTPERVGEIYGALDRLDEWITAFRSFVFAEVSQGRPIPGVALKRKRTNRVWLDDAMVAEALGGRLFVFAPQQLLSPPKMEAACKSAGVDFPEHLVVKAEGELTLCRADDTHALPPPSDTASRFLTLETP